MLPERLPAEADPLVLERDAVDRVIRAWVDFSGDAPPKRITTLLAPRYRGKSVVFDLGRVGPGGEGVVAKELSRQATALEETVYTQILPGLTVSGPRLIGTAGSDEPGRAWLFLEEIAGPAFDKTEPEHVAIASTWLAGLHSGTLDVAEGLLPERLPHYYRSLASRTVTELEEVSGNIELTPAQVDVLRKLGAHLDTVLASFDFVADVYAALPTAVVHGDFKANNMAFSSMVGLQQLRVFDWSEAHIGPVAIDAQWVDAGYVTAMANAGAGLEGMKDLDWRSLSRLTRLICSVAWEIPGLRYEWVDRPMRRMSRYESRFASVLAQVPWLR